MRKSLLFILLLITSISTQAQDTSNDSVLSTIIGELKQLEDFKLTYNGHFVFADSTCRDSKGTTEYYRARNDSIWGYTLIDSVFYADVNQHLVDIYDGSEMLYLKIDDKKFRTVNYGSLGFDTKTILINSNRITPLLNKLEFILLNKEPYTLTTDSEHIKLKFTSAYALSSGAKPTKMTYKHITGQTIEITFNRSTYLPTHYFENITYNNSNAPMICEEEFAFETIEHKTISIYDYIPSNFIPYDPFGGKLGVGKLAYSFSLPTNHNDSLSLNQLKERVVVIMFSSEFCGGCRQAIPQINELRQKMQGKDVIFLYIDVDKRTKFDALQKFAKEQKIEMPCLSDNGTVSGQYGVTGVPTFFLINQKRVIADRLIGANISDTLETKILELLN